MTRAQAAIVICWRTTIGRAIALGLEDVAYRLTRGLVRRCVELGLW